MYHHDRFCTQSSRISQAKWAVVGSGRFLTSSKSVRRIRSSEAGIFQIRLLPDEMVPEFLLRVVQQQLGFQAIPTTLCLNSGQAQRFGRAPQ